jgi:hypothetical protein
MKDKVFKYIDEKYWDEMLYITENNTSGEVYKKLSIILIKNLP